MGTSGGNRWICGGEASWARMTEADCPPKTSARSERCMSSVGLRSWPGVPGCPEVAIPCRRRRCVSDMTSGGSGCQRTIPGRIRKI